MKTKNKVFAAKIIFYLITFFYRKKNFVCSRKNLNWNLDLNEAIDLHIFLFGQFEPEIKNVAKKLKLNETKKILDIGANFGVQSLQFAKEFKDSKIFSIEPTNYAFSKMKKNFDLNKNLLGNLFPYQMFFGEKNQDLPKSIYSSWNLDSKEKKHFKHCGITKDTSNASSTTLDEFVNINNIENVDFIKLDVDGFELDVLKGGINFLKKNKPPIFMELAPYLYKEFGYEIEKLTNFLVSLEYKFYNLKKIKQIKNIDSYSKMIKDGSSENILLL